MEKWILELQVFLGQRHHVRCRSRVSSSVNGKERQARELVLVREWFSEFEMNRRDWTSGVRPRKQAVGTVG